jgi:hypothetical protein
MGGIVYVSMTTICSVVTVRHVQQVALHVTQLEPPVQLVILLTDLSGYKAVVYAVPAYISLQQELSAQIVHLSSQCAQTAIKLVASTANHHLHSLVLHASALSAPTTIQ